VFQDVTLPGWNAQAFLRPKLTKKLVGFFLWQFRVCSDIFGPKSGPDIACVLLCHSIRPWRWLTHVLAIIVSTVGFDCDKGVICLTAVVKTSFFHSILIYMPSLMVRYAAQLLSIGLPWVMQMRGRDLSVIAINASWFFGGSVLGGLVFYRISRRIPIHWFLRMTLVVQSILFLIIFLVEDDLFLCVIRFVQGFTFGLFRPTNQIWVNEYEKTQDRLMLAKRATYTKVVISFGLFLGSIVGSFAKDFVETPFSAILFSGWVCVVPSFLLYVILVLTSPDYREEVRALKMAEKDVPPSSEECESVFAWFIRHPESRTALGIFAAGMITFDIWNTAVPFALRQKGISWGLMSSDQFVSFLLISIAFVYSICQFFINHFVKKLDRGVPTNVWLLTGVAVAQMLLIGSCLIFLDEPLLCYGLVFIGGAIVPAFIYPLFMLILYAQVKHSQGFLMRRIIVFLNLTSDVAQFAGHSLVAFPLHGHSQTWWLVAPAALVGVLFLWYLLDQYRGFKRLKIAGKVEI
jgi:MFS family permease